MNAGELRWLLTCDLRRRGGGCGPPVTPTGPRFMGELRAPEFMSLFNPPQPISVRGRPRSHNRCLFLPGPFPGSAATPPPPASLQDICSEAFAPESDVL